MNIEFPPGTPDEVQEFYRKQIDKQQMAMQVEHNRIKRFFGETLDLDGMIVLKSMFERVASLDDPGAGAQYWIGYLSSLMEVKYNVCPGCGENHDEDFDAAMKAHGIVADIGADIVAAAEQYEQATGVEPTTLVPPGVENPDMPGFDMDGRRLPSCGSCGGDRIISVCEHNIGMHGQGDGRCPEPTVVPCPECRTPEWYKHPELLSCGRPGCEGQLLPLEEPFAVICSDCKRRAHAG